MKKLKVLSLVLAAILIAGLLIPEPFVAPVEGTKKSDFNQKSFWYYPWGKSGTHKGVDIFAKQRTPVIAATGGLVIYSGKLERGGNVVLILGPKWRLHYYAHLNDISTTFGTWVSTKEKIGTVGTTGNAAGKAPHLHYSIVTLLPHVWRIDGAQQGWKKMFYLDPIPLLNNSLSKDANPPPQSRV